MYQPVTNDSGWRVWGIDRLVEDLKRAVATRPRHAYILSGPDHVGKRTLALEFARALTCQNPPEIAVPCGTCANCRRAARGVQTDITYANLETQRIRERGASGNTSLNIATVREISSSVALRPSEGDWRIAIVDDVETMQETAQEAFLKTLEEPPFYTIILLLTTDADLLLPTIRSRCVTYSLQPSSDKDVRHALEASGVDSSLAATIASASDGRIGWGFLAANDEALLAKRLESARIAQQWASAGEYQRLVTATRLADQFAKDREAVFVQLLTVQRTWRSIMFNSLDITRTSEASSDNTNAIVGAVRSVEGCILDLESNVRPRLAIQSMVLQWPPLS